MPHDPDGPEHRPPLLAEGGEYMGAGFQFAGAILFFLLVGRWLDERLGTDPWLLILGVLVGGGAGFFSLYRQLVIVPREREERRKARRDEP